MHCTWTGKDRDGEVWAYKITPDGSEVISVVVESDRAENRYRVLVIAVKSKYPRSRVMEGQTRVWYENGVTWERDPCFKRLA